MKWTYSDPGFLFLMLDVPHISQRNTLKISRVGHMLLNAPSTPGKFSTALRLLLDAKELI